LTGTQATPARASPKTTAIVAIELRIITATRSPAAMPRVRRCAAKAAERRSISA
jgi:hypothetical protein